MDKEKTTEFIDGIIIDDNESNVMVPNMEMKREIEAETTSPNIAGFKRDIGAGETEEVDFDEFNQYLDTLSEEVSFNLEGEKLYLRDFFIRRQRFITKNILMNQTRYQVLNESDKAFLINFDSGNKFIELWVPKSVIITAEQYQQELKDRNINMKLNQALKREAEIKTKRKMGNFVKNNDLYKLLKIDIKNEKELNEFKDSIIKKYGIK